MPSSQYKAGAVTIHAYLIFFQLSQCFCAEFKMIASDTETVISAEYTIST